MKKAKIFVCAVLFFVGLILVAGACRAWENDIIGFGGCALRSAIGVVMLLAVGLLAEDQYDNVE